MKGGGRKGWYKREGGKEGKEEEVFHIYMTRTFTECVCNSLKNTHIVPVFLISCCRRCDRSGSF